MAAAHGAGDLAAAEFVVEQLGKFVHEVAQIGAALEGHTRHIDAKQLAGRHSNQIGVGAVVLERHLGHNANAQAQAHVSLDHIRVNGFEGNTRMQVLGGKSLVDLGPSGK